MIINFRHKGLKRLFEKGDRSKIDAAYADKISRILVNLHLAEAIENIDFPGYRLHKLRGDMKDFYSVWVSGNWRIVFKFKEGKAIDIDFVDYH